MENENIIDESLNFRPFRGEIKESLVVEFLGISNSDLAKTDGDITLDYTSGSVEENVLATVRAALKVCDELNKLIPGGDRYATHPGSISLWEKCDKLKKALAHFKVLKSGDFEVSSLQTKQVRVTLSDGRSDNIEYPYYVVQSGNQKFELPSGCLLPENGEEAAMRLRAAGQL